MFWGVIRSFEHSFAIVRVFLFISIVCFIPRFFVTINKSFPVNLNLPSSEEPYAYTLGIENIKKEFIVQLCPTKANCKVGLIASTHQQGLESLAILSSKTIDVTRIIYFDDYRDKIILDRDLFSELDILLIDIVDLDCVYNQQVSLFFSSIAQWATCGKHIIILDRPNMMGEKIEGPLYCFGSEHKYIKLPAYHAMTVGELAQYYNNQALRGEAKIHVIPMRDYYRVCTPIAYRSAQADHFLGYNLCRILAYIEPINVGLETAYPYSCILLSQSIPFPEQQWHRLQAILRDLGLNSTLFRCVNQRTHEVYRGLRFNPPQMAHVDSFKAVLSVIEFFKSIGLPLSFSDSFYAKMGTSLVRQYVKGMISKKRFVLANNEELGAFYRTAFGVFMYYPLPQLCLL